MIHNDHYFQNNVTEYVMTSQVSSITTGPERREVKVWDGESPQWEEWCIALLFCSTGPPWTSLLSSAYSAFSPQRLLNCSFLFYFLLLLLFTFLIFRHCVFLLLSRCVSVVTRCRLLLLGPLRVCSKSRQPLTAFAPDFIRNSGPYSLFFSIR